MQEGIYEQLINKKIRQQLQELEGNSYGFHVDKMDVDDAKLYLSTYISTVTERALAMIREESKQDPQALLKQIQVCNEIIDILNEQLNDEEFQRLRLDEQGEILTAVFDKMNHIYAVNEKPIERPITSITHSSLFTGSTNEPNLLEELKKEITSSDRIDWLVSFIKWSGIRNLIDSLQSFTERGGKLRIITTSYMEATDVKAIERLAVLNNTEIKVSLDKKRTRLHAKAYLFKRNSEFSTAYIGSSNLSNPALTAGLEWNMKITEKDSLNIVRKCDATFESYWNDPEYILLDKDDSMNWHRFRASLITSHVADERESYFLDIRPYYYQQEILDNLQAEREVHQRWKNLVIAATGVGKTVISAFDFKQFRQKHPKAKLLFIAHREEILKQSLHTFRHIFKDENFGDLFVGRNQAQSLDHLFMSIQSWNSKKMYEKVEKDFYDFIIVDEFHHAAAKTYECLLQYYEPKVLLGLTATPERMDGQNVLEYFDDYIASEMRLKEAIDRKLLSPFHYFCVTDHVDLSNLSWSKRGYDREELSNLYTANDRRSNLIIRAIDRYVTDINSVKGIGFCVSVEHARYMATYFNYKDIPSIALHGQSPAADRNDAKRKLQKGEIHFIFVVDLYNEGVDIPEINTVLFLRPTESLTIFLQQLGRGLRLSDNKECLTVLDFVGQAHKDYPFEEKFRALVGPTKHSIRHYIENGFFNMPKGSVIHMEKVAKDYILRNVVTTKTNKAQLIRQIQSFENDTEQRFSLYGFLKYHHLTLSEFYGRSRNRSLSRLKVEAGIASDFDAPYEDVFMKQIHKLFYIDSKTLIDAFVQIIDKTEEVNDRIVAMLYYSFFQQPPNHYGFASLQDGLAQILQTEQLKKELLEVLHVCKENIHFIEKTNPFPYDVPLRTHAHYTTDQIFAALGYYNESRKPQFREGVKYLSELKTDLFFITLNKSDKDFSAATQYEDYAINEQLFHWQSQNRTSEASPTGQRYIHHAQTGNHIALFVREFKQKDGFTAPFTFLGTAQYVSHEGNRPISFVWNLDEPLPANIVPEAKKSIL